jgi:hypothetical protein
MENILGINLETYSIEEIKRLFLEKESIGICINGGGELMDEVIPKCSLTDISDAFPKLKLLRFNSYFGILEGLESFKQLQELGFYNDSFELFKNVIHEKMLYPEIDLLSFLNLEQFTSWTLKNVINLEKTKINSIRLTKKFATKDLSKINFPQTLERLWLGYSPISSLSGIEKAVNLKTLTIQMLGKLSDMSILSNLENLEILSIRGCRSIDYDSLKSSNLRSLSIYVETEHSKNKLTSLHFLKNLPSLETLDLMCPIIGGDMTPILELPNLKKVSFADKSHYSHTLKQIYDLKNLK